MDMWQALSDTERQQFTKEADINQMRIAEYDEWVEAVGYTSMRKINRDRVRAGKKPLRVPASLCPVRKLSAYTTFFEAKIASGEVSSSSEALLAAKKRARQLWRQLTPSQKVIYEAQSKANYQQRLADRSQA
ncbi:hypothetical protein BKA62DRAFT_771184 [Auriculariales sp. MPI-PUGE-AT-0066]|nr:hypothetical protein BKA62DRAFT_771184 [Auriculariales sp. MPI-PUGE-AT-0066]